MRLMSTFLASALFLIATVGCTGFESISLRGIQANDISLVLKQNTSASMDVEQGVATMVIIKTPPLFGHVSIKGTDLTYKPISPLYSGPDTFEFVLSNGSRTSNVATASVVVTPITAGTYQFLENYSGQNYALSGWNQYSSTFGLLPTSLTSFTPATFNGASVSARRFKINGDLNSYLGDAAYQNLFGVLPVDGSGGAMHDFPWMAETIHLPECSVDVSITLQVGQNSGQYPMGAVLLNYKIDRGSSQTLLTGYQLLFNSGGGSLTLSRFNGVDQSATAYLDRWPNTNFGTEANVNPVSYGPYKGWNYKAGVWPAGGNVGVGPFTLALRYQYDYATGMTKISYESRSLNGTDQTPGVYDEVVTLSGADSLPPGGDFGIMATNWHMDGMINSTDFNVSNLSLSCTIP